MTDIRLLNVLLASALWCGSAYGDSVTLTPLRDTSIYSSSDDLSNGQGDLFVGSTGEGVRQRALLAFDVAAEIEAGATITRARLSLTLKRASADSGVQQLSLHRLLADWGEGASLGPGGGGANAAANDATWRFRFFPEEDRVWENPGGDFETAASADRMIGEDPGRGAWESDGLVADVQAWLDDPQRNHGWLLAGNESRGNTARRFFSREAESTDDQPMLQIEFEPPANDNGDGDQPMDGQDSEDDMPDTTQGCGFGIPAAMLAGLILAVPCARSRRSATPR